MGDLVRICEEELKMEEEESRMTVMMAITKTIKIREREQIMLGSLESL